jgi:hypothetical protein
MISFEIMSLKSILFFIFLFFCICLLYFYSEYWISSSVTYWVFKLFFLFGGVSMMFLPSLMNRFIKEDKEKEIKKILQDK